MKKIIFTFVVLFAAFFAASSVSSQSAPKVDLQIQKAFEYTSYIFNPASQLFITIQNNGPDDFEGSFDVSVSDGNGGVISTFAGLIPAFGTADMNVLGNPKNVAYSIFLDPNEKIQERNKNNNYLCYKASEPQVRMVSGGLIAEHLFDTLYVTPGELYDSQFAVADLNNHNSIIGVNLEMMAYDLDQLWFSTAVNYVNNTQDGYTCSVKESYEFGKELSISLLANSSEYSSGYHWMGYFYGYGENQIGKVGSIYLFAKFAQSNLQNGNDYARRIVKVRDAIRCDLNGDGIVDREDFDILKTVVDSQIYNNWTERSKRYNKEGINYGAGRILFSQPDFLSVALLNIWLNNPNDLLVQGLGIGELMSTTMPGNEASSVKPIDNTFSVSENGEVVIDAPDADVYNVTAQDAEGKLVQRTGRLGEDILLPVGVKNVHVETVKIKNGTTGLFSPKSIGPKVSVYPNPVTDYVNISSPEAGQLSVMNLNGQEIYSQPINAQESLTLSTGDWAKGIYLIKIATDNGQSTVKVVK